MLREQGSRPLAWPPSSRGSGLSEASQGRCRHLPEEGPSRLHAHRCRTCRARQSKPGPGTCRAQAAWPEVSGYRATGLEAGSNRHQRRRGVGTLCSLQATVAGAKALKTESKRVSGLRLRLTAASLDKNHTGGSTSSDSHLSLGLRLSVLPVVCRQVSSGTPSTEYCAQALQLQPAPPQSIARPLSCLHASFSEAGHDRTPSGSPDRAAGTAGCDRLH